MCDSFYGGCEPEFTTEEQWDNYENINNEHYFYTTEIEEKEKLKSLTKNSPYKDKNIPFLIYKK